jgi:hypothetical protein
MKTAVARVLVAAGVLFGMTLAMAGPAAAACPAPSISVNPSSGRGGDGFTITGRNFFSACSDAGNQGDTNIQFRFLQGSNVFDLGSATAGTPDGDFSGTLYVPTNTSAGAATVQAFGQNGSPSVPFQVTASTLTTNASTATTRATTATTAAGTTPTTAVAPPAPASTSNASTTTTASTSTPTTATTLATAPASSGGGLSGAGLAITIVLLVLVVLGTIIASLATAGRLPLPGRHRPRGEPGRDLPAPAPFPTAAVAASDADDSTAPIELTNPFEPEETAGDAVDTDDTAPDEPEADEAPADEETSGEPEADAGHRADELEFPEEPPEKS